MVFKHIQLQFDTLIFHFTSLLKKVVFFLVVKVRHIFLVFCFSFLHVLKPVFLEKQVWTDPLQ